MKHTKLLLALASLGATFASAATVTTTFSNKSVQSITLTAPGFTASYGGCKELALNDGSVTQTAVAIRTSGDSQASAAFYTPDHNVDTGSGWQATFTYTPTAETTLSTIEVDYGLFGGGGWQPDTVTKRWQYRVSLSSDGKSLFAPDYAPVTVPGGTNGKVTAKATPMAPITLTAGQAYTLTVSIWNGGTPGGGAFCGVHRIAFSTDGTPPPPQPEEKRLIWQGVNRVGNWMTEKIWLADNVPTTFSEDNAVRFPTTTLSQYAITIDQAVAPKTMEIATNNTNAHTFFGSNGGLSGTGTITKSGGDGIVFCGEHTFAGDLKVNEGSCVIFGQSHAKSIYNAGNTSIIAPPTVSTYTLSANLSGNKAFDKRGRGTLILTGKNTYAEQTHVYQGTLQIDGTHTGGWNYTIHPEATLAGKGAIGSNVEFKAGAQLLLNPTADSPLTVTGTVSGSPTIVWSQPPTVGQRYPLMRTTGNTTNFHPQIGSAIGSVVKEGDTWFATVTRLPATYTWQAPTAPAEPTWSASLPDATALDHARFATNVAQQRVSIDAPAQVDTVAVDGDYLWTIQKSLTASAITVKDALTLQANFPTATTTTARFVRVNFTGRSASGQNADGLALAEISLLHAGKRLSISGNQVTATNAKTTGTHSDDHLVDNNLSTKWYWSGAQTTITGDAGQVLLDAGAGKTFTFDTYQFALADQNGRNPTSWTLDVRDDAADTWRTIDSQDFPSSIVTQWTVNAWHAPFEQAAVLQATLTIAPAATLALDLSTGKALTLNGEIATSAPITLTGLPTDQGTITLLKSNQSSLTFSVKPGEPAGQIAYQDGAYHYTPAPHTVTIAPDPSGESIDPRVVNYVNQIAQGTTPTLSAKSATLLYLFLAQTIPESPETLDLAVSQLTFDGDSFILRADPGFAATAIAPGIHVSLRYKATLDSPWQISTIPATIADGKIVFNQALPAGATFFQVAVTE